MIKISDIVFGSPESVGLVDDDQTFNEHEFLLRCLNSLVTSKYLTELMLLNTPALSTCTDP